MGEAPTRIPMGRPSAAPPLWTAAWSSTVYMVMCSLYIAYSSWYAASLASTPRDLQVIETAKGIGFVAVTGVIYFLISLALFRRIFRQNATIAAQEIAMLRTERKLMGALSFAVIAHDLNNLLMVMSGMFEDLKRQGKGNEPLQDLCDRVGEGIGNLSRLCERIASSTAHVLPDKKELTDMNDALRRLVAIARRHPDVRSCSISVPEAPAASLLLNRALLEEAVLNLLINAAQATGPKGRIELRMMYGGNKAILAVHDNGPGIPADLVERVFDPCFTTKPDGTGIGLVAVKAFAASCGGNIIVGKSELGGALFQIDIPMTDGPPGQAPQSAGTEGAPQHGG